MVADFGGVDVELARKSFDGESVFARRNHPAQILHRVFCTLFDRLDVQLGAPGETGPDRRGVF